MLLTLNQLLIDTWVNHWIAERGHTTRAALPRDGFESWSSFTHEVDHRVKQLAERCQIYNVCPKLTALKPKADSHPLTSDRLFSTEDAVFSEKASLLPMVRSRCLGTEDRSVAVGRY
jgi:hypothetical protein